MTQQLWPSPAKLNLFLYITGQRPNGYHDLQTLFQFVDYGDSLSFTVRDDSAIVLTTPTDGVAVRPTQRPCSSRSIRYGIVAILIPNWRSWVSASVPMCPFL